MSPVGGSFGRGASGAASAEGVTPQIPVSVYTCSRIGRVANPPGFSLSDWLRARRR